MAKWSEEAWLAAEPIYKQILQHPFVVELATGKLPLDKFKFYIYQDALYLDNYSAVLADIASRLQNKEFMNDFLRFASDGIKVEKAIHDSFLDGIVPQKENITPACMLYTTVLRSQSCAPVEVAAAAILPCFWIYSKVGEWIVNNTNSDSNPYSLWIDTYSDDYFAEATRRAITICDALAENASENIRQRMTELFVLCTKMEWMFWDSAWHLEQWPV